ncbi:Oidioi.mRNA.OKI2018_I69.PAR.g9999.t1.cds [Oikopleura dioica]|uniref:Oidioi.mRNA.OKI2018_I69.PAR.g9999.t1.cds n=1 Tax=Oikopleura dioica TaxID=34765 RepID=A0ABN7RRY8_OIKDI|nr:Oidioi.mRNA.OKI2018_I69.PAR.g9999.t1.cds [Oikopleura dioica]
MALLTEKLPVMDFAGLRRKSLERLSRIPLILRKNRPRKIKSEPVVFENENFESKKIVPVEDERQEKEYDCAKKPPYSYMAMIEMALSSTPEHRMSLQEIYRWIENRFLYFKTAKPGWKNSVRHNLSLHDIFYRDSQNTSKVSFWCMKKKVQQLPNIEDLEGPCIPQNRLPRPDLAAPSSSDSFFLKLEPISENAAESFEAFQTPKNRQVLSQISVNRLQPRNSQQKENISPTICSNLEKTPTMPFRKRVLGERNLNSSASPIQQKNSLLEVQKGISPPKSQDSGFQSDATSSTTLNNMNCDPATPVKNCSFDAIVDRYYVDDINEMNFSRDSFMDFINDLATPFSALKSSTKKAHSSTKKYRSPFNPIHSSTPARKLDFGNKRKSSSRALFQDDANSNKENHDESPIPFKRVPTAHKIEDLLP